MDLLAPSLAAAFLGVLAFAAHLLHLRRTDSKAATLRAVGDIRTLIEGRVRTAEARADALETERKKLSKRVGDLEFRTLGKRLTPEADER